MLPGSEGGGGRCQAPVPAAHYQCPGGGRSRSIASLLGKGSGSTGGGHWKPRTSPRSRSCEGRAAEEEEEEGQAPAGSQLQPASATPPALPRKETAGSCSLARAASKSPAGSSSSPPEDGRRGPGDAASGACAQGASGLPGQRERLPPGWSRAPGLRRGARSPAPGAPEAAGLASPWPLRPLLQRVRRKDGSTLRGPRGASLATERGHGARCAGGLRRPEWQRWEGIPGRDRGAQERTLRAGIRVLLRGALDSRSAAQPGAGGRRGEVPARPPASSGRGQRDRGSRHRRGGRGARSGAEAEPGAGAAEPGGVVCAPDLGAAPTDPGSPREKAARTEVRTFSPASPPPGPGGGRLHSRFWKGKEVSDCTPPTGVRWATQDGARCPGRGALKLK